MDLWSRTPSPIYFFDATAIVKWVCPEPGSKTVTELVSCTPVVFTSWVLVAEALGVLKRKWRNNDLTDRKYAVSAHYLLAYLELGKLRPADVGIVQGQAKLLTYSSSVDQVRQRHPHLDVADALQFRAIKEGILKYFVDESRPQLVTADAELLKAARCDGIPVVDVSCDP